MDEELNKEIDKAIADLSNKTLQEWFRYFYDLGFCNGESCGANSIVPAE